MAERRFTLIFYLAVIVAGFATYGVYRVLEANEANGRIRTIPVVVAMTDLPEGSQIAEDAVTTSQWPEQTIPAGAFTSAKDVVGRVTRVAVFKGEPLVPGRLAPKGTGPGIEVMIAPGKRAMAVRINDVAGLNGLVQPGSRVDMLVTLRDGYAGREAGVAKLFMENLKVLSVGSKVTRSTDNEPINAATATLEVTPTEAEQIALAMKEGSIQLVLRGYGDPDNVTTRGATEQDVLARMRDPQLVAALRRAEDSVAAEAGRRAAERRAAERRLASRPATRPAPAAAEPAPTLAARPDSVAIRVYRGGTVSQTKFEKADSTRRTP